MYVDFTQVAVPFLRAKTHDYYEQLGGGVSSDILEDAAGGRRTQALSDDVSIIIFAAGITYGHTTVSSGALASSIQEDIPMGEHFLRAVAARL